MVELKVSFHMLWDFEKKTGSLWVQRKQLTGLVCVVSPAGVESRFNFLQRGPYQKEPDVRDYFFLSLLLISRTMVLPLWVF